MNFVEMIKLIDKDYKITNPSLFLNNLLYIEYIEGYGVVTNGNVYDRYDFDFTDYYDENWEIYKEQPKLHTFEEAIVAFKKGHTIKRANIKGDWMMVYGESSLIDHEDIIANDWIIMGKED